MQILTIDQLRTAKANMANLSLAEVGTIMFGLVYIVAGESGEDGVYARATARQALNVLQGRPRDDERLLAPKTDAVLAAANAIKDRTGATGALVNRYSHIDLPLVIPADDDPSGYPQA